MIWERGQVSYEFCGSFYLLLQRFSDHHPSSQDENEYDMILDMLVNLHRSKNFETLMCFDPTLRWLFSCFPPALIQRVSDTTLESLREGNCADFVILSRCIQLGIGDPFQFDEALTLALSRVGFWAHLIQKEARSTLALLPISIPTAVTPAVIQLISEVLRLPSAAVEPSLYIVAQFLTSYFLGTAAPLHFPLLNTLLSMMSAADGKKTLPLDIQTIVVAICSNPVRFLEILQSIGDKRPLLFSILKQPDLWDNSLLLALVAPGKSDVSSDARAKAAVKMIKERGLTAEEKDGCDLYHKFQIYLPLSIALYPAELRRLIEHLPAASDEDFTMMVIQVFLLVALQGRNAAECNELRQCLPAATFACEYTDLLRLLNATLETIPTPLEKLIGHIDPSLSQFLVVGSPSNIAAALLFEHVIWAERGQALVIFERLRLNPGAWFALAVASLFCSIVENSEESLIPLFDQRVKNSAQNLVWIGVLLFRRMLPELRRILVTEVFDDLPKALFYPLLHFQASVDDEMTMDELDGQYANVLKDLFSVMVPVREAR
jgi:hypothetical protein